MIASRITLGVFLVFCMIATPNPVCAAGLNIFTPTGADADPLTGAFPLALRPSESRTVDVFLSNDQGSGFVLPTVTCCTDVLTGAQISPPGLSMGFFFKPVRIGWRSWLDSPGVWVSPGTTSIARMLVTTTAAVSPGQYKARVSASDPAMGASEQTIYVNILGPTPSDDTVTPCRAQVNNVVVGNGTPPKAEVLPVKGAVDSLFNAKAASPQKTTFSVGAAATASTNAWELEIGPQDPVPAVPLRPDEAVIVFSNESPGEKDLWTINSAACMSLPQHLHLTTNQSAMITIRKSDTTTLLLRRDVCGFSFIVCWGTWSEPVALFSEPAFWSLVGGRVTKIRWIVSR